VICGWARDEAYACAGKHAAIAELMRRFRFCIVMLVTPEDPGSGGYSIGPVSSTASSPTPGSTSHPSVTSRN
jgi:hypothetical protein